MTLEKKFTYSDLLFVTMIGVVFGISLVEDCRTGSDAWKGIMFIFGVMIVCIILGTISEPK